MVQDAMHNKDFFQALQAVARRSDDNCTCLTVELSRVRIPDSSICLLQDVDSWTRFCYM